MTFTWFSSSKLPYRAVNKLKVDTFFWLRCELRTHPFRTILIIFLVLPAISLGFGLRAVEMTNMNNSFQDYFSVANALWCITNTITTLGYGDFHPSTYMGRFVATIAAVWGLLIYALFIFTLANGLLKMNPKQEKAYWLYKRD